MTVSNHPSQAVSDGELARWEAFLHALPKVELHCHLLGTIRRATFTDLVRRERAPVSDDEITAYYTRGEKPVGVLKAFRTMEAHLLTRTDDLHRLTLEYLEDAAAHQVRWAEFFWNPTGCLAGGRYSYAQAQSAIAAGIRDARSQWGIEGRLIVAVDREAPPAAAVQMMEQVLAHRAEETIGLGIDYRENDRPPELFTEAYAMARRGGLKTTAHAGEFGMPWTNVRTALEALKVDRIDHGYTVVDAPEFARRCADEGIVFTVVPTNSHYLRTLPPERWALDHPIRRMPGMGLKVHPNTDDPTLHLTTPTRSWLMMVRDFGFGLDDVRQFMLNGLDGAWIDGVTRARWRAGWLAELDVLQVRHGLVSPVEGSSIP